MNDTCKCPPDDCHGGHTINIGPARLTDEQLRRLTEYVHPDETTDYVRPWLHSMAAELLELRRLASSWPTRLQELTAQAAELDRRGRELETAQREPIGYAVTMVDDGDRYIHTGAMLARETATGIAEDYRQWGARVVELREVTDHG